MIAPGFYPDLPAEEYHNDPAIGSSGLRKIVNQSPAHYRAERKETAAMVKGSAVHTFLLEPEKFAEQYQVAPPEFKAWTSAEAKKFKKEVEDAGKIPLKQSEMDELTAIQDAFMRTEIGRGLFNLERHIEPSFFWIDEETGIACKARPDIWVPSYGYMFDLKTASDASQKKFTRSVMDQAYHVQAAFHKEGVEQTTGIEVKACYWLVIETSPPFATAFYKASDLMLDAGKSGPFHGYRSALEIYRQCLETNHWPGYLEEFLELELPNYYEW